MKTTKPLYIALGMVLGAAVLALIAAAPDPGIGHFPGITLSNTNVYRDSGTSLTRNGTNYLAQTFNPTTGSMPVNGGGVWNDTPFTLLSSSHYQYGPRSGSRGSVDFLYDGLGGAQVGAYSKNGTKEAQLQTDETANNTTGLNISGHTGGAVIYPDLDGGSSPNVSILVPGTNSGVIFQMTDFTAGSGVRTNITIKKASGWTGTGANALTDDGTFKPLGGGDTIWTNSAGKVTLLSGSTNVALRSWLSLSGLPNQIADNGTTLTYNGTPIGTNIYSNDVVWAQSPPGTGSLNPAVSNLVISMPSVQTLPLRIDSNSTLAVQFGLDTGHQNSSSGYKGSAFQWNMNLNSGNDSVFGVFQSQLFPGTDTYTGNRLVHAYFANDIAAAGTNMIYYGEGAVGLMGEANSTGPSAGDSIGVFGVVDSNVTAPITGFGVAGLAWDFNDLGQTMIGVAGSSILKSGINVGGYFEVSSTMTNPVFESAAILLDNRDSGVPILIARSNQVRVAAINANGSISAGNTNQWTLGGVTNGAPHVGVDGTDYPLAALNGDGSLSVGGTLPSYFTNGVQDATLAANTLVGNDSTNKLVSATAAMVATALGYTPQATNSTIGAFGATTLAATATVSLPIIMPYTGHITGWSISADGSSPTVTFDVLKESAGGTAIPSVSIMGTKPALAAGNVVHSTAVSDWTTNFNAGDIFMIKVDTGNIVSTAVQLTLETLR